MRDDEKDKRQKSSGSGKSPTKFMERPGTEPKKESQNQAQPEFIEDDLDALESQEQEGPAGGDADSKGWKPPVAPKNAEKPDPWKSQKPEKKGSDSDDAGDCACP